MEAERQTRKTRVDPQLNAAGWSVVSFPGTRPLDQAVAVEEYPTDFGPADCGLADRGLVLGVEAKKLTVGPQDAGRRPPAVLTKAFRGGLTGAA